MNQYEHSITINSNPKQIFKFVSEIANLPRYLPTVTHAAPQGSERVRVQGEAAGQRYESDGYYRVDNAHQRIEWGSDGENEYHGWLKVTGDERKATITAHLSFDPRPEIAERYDEQSGDRHRTIQDGLERALHSIKNHCEGKGGKVESRVA